MNAQNAKDFLPLVQSLAEGKTIQYNTGDIGSDEWQDTLTPSFNGPIWDYRIKPEPREWIANMNCDDSGSIHTNQKDADINRSRLKPGCQQIRVREILD